MQLGNLHDAEEAVQDVFLTAFRKWDRLLAADNLQGMFFTMLKHRVIDQRRSQKRKSKLEAAGEDVPEDQLAVEDPGLRSLETRLLLEEGLRRLPERQRDVITLRLFLEMSTRETAQTMGIAEATVAVHLRQARTRLARLLAAAQEQP